MDLPFGAGADRRSNVAHPMKSPGWLMYALVTTLLWGVWGAFTNLPEAHGFPATLIYVVWALTMIPVALFALHRNGWKVQHDRRSLVLGGATGLLGAGGQMVLFHAVKVGAPYLVFPIVSLSPVVTIGLSYALLKERTGALGKLGTAAALCSLPLFDWAPGKAPAALGSWFVLAVGVMVAWGVQAYVIKLANATMDAESIFLYMAVAGILFMPVAIAMTDFSAPIHMGPSGPLLAAATQLLNSIGSLTLVYAFRQGKALVVSPLINAGAPLLTSVIAMAGASALPGRAKMAGIVMALFAALLLALQPEDGPKGLREAADRN